MASQRRRRPHGTPLRLLDAAGAQRLAPVRGAARSPHPRTSERGRRVLVGPLGSAPEGRVQLARTAGRLLPLQEVISGDQLRAALRRFTGAGVSTVALAEAPSRRALLRQIDAAAEILAASGTLRMALPASTTARELRAVRRLLAPGLQAGVVVAAPAAARDAAALAEPAEFLLMDDGLLEEPDAAGAVAAAAWEAGVPLAAVARSPSRAGVATLLELGVTRVHVRGPHIARVRAWVAAAEAGTALRVEPPTEALGMMATAYARDEEDPCPLAS